MDAAVQFKTLVNNTGVLPKGPLWSDVIGACARMYRQYSLILHLYLMVNLDPELHTTDIYIALHPTRGHWVEMILECCLRANRYESSPAYTNTIYICELYLDDDMIVIL